MSRVDILHAWRNRTHVFDQEYDGREQLFVIGPARDGTLLELVAVPVRGPHRIIHADRLRPKFHQFLRGESR